MGKSHFLGAMALLLVVGACSGGTRDQSAGESPPNLDQDKVAAGQDLYERFCASCHQADLAGDPDWKTPNADGSYPPPPHDSTGHTWHHGDGLLVEIILDGMDFEQSRMPVFQGQLTENQVLSIVEYFKAQWGPEEREFQWQATIKEQS